MTGFGKHEKLDYPCFQQFDLNKVNFVPTRKSYIGREKENQKTEIVIYVPKPFD